MRRQRRQTGNALQHRPIRSDATLGGLARFREGGGGEDIDQTVQRALRRQGEDANCIPPRRRSPAPRKQAPGRPAGLRTTHPASEAAGRDCGDAERDAPNPMRRRVVERQPRRARRQQHVDRDTGQPGCRDDEGEAEDSLLHGGRPDESERRADRAEREQHTAANLDDGAAPSERGRPGGSKAAPTLSVSTVSAIACRARPA
jgi:hypothetical protein